MKVGVIGSGVVGQTLAKGFIDHGHTVIIGTRDSSKLEEWNKSNNGEVGSFDDAAKFGELVVLAVKGKAAVDAVRLAGADNLKGKTVIDATNPIEDAPPENGVLKFFTSLNQSLMEILQTDFPDINFVKAFSCVGNAFMVNPDFGNIKPSMFICGNNAEAKNQVNGILKDFGWDIEDMGTVEAARAIEPLCILWCIPGLTKNTWTHAFKLLKK